MDVRDFNFNLQIISSNFLLKQLIHKKYTLVVIKPYGHNSLQHWNLFKENRKYSIQPQSISIY